MQSLKKYHRHELICWNGTTPLWRGSLLLDCLTWRFSTRSAFIWSGAEILFAVILVYGEDNAQGLIISLWSAIVCALWFGFAHLSLSTRTPMWCGNNWQGSLLILLQPWWRRTQYSFHFFSRFNIFVLNTILSSLTLTASNSLLEPIMLPFCNREGRPCKQTENI